MGDYMFTYLEVSCFLSGWMLASFFIYLYEGRKEKERKLNKENTISEKPTNSFNILLKEFNSMNEKNFKLNKNVTSALIELEEAIKHKDSAAVRWYCYSAIKSLKKEMD